MIDLPHIRVGEIESELAAAEQTMRTIATVRGHQVIAVNNVYRGVRLVGIVCIVHKPNESADRSLLYWFPRHGFAIGINNSPHCNACPFDCDLTFINHP